MSLASWYVNKRWPLNNNPTWLSFLLFSTIFPSWERALRTVQPLLYLSAWPHGWGLWCSSMTSSAVEGQSQSICPLFFSINKSLLSLVTKSTLSYAMSFSLNYILLLLAPEPVHLLDRLVNATVPSSLSWERLESPLWWCSLSDFSFRPWRGPCSTSSTTKIWLDRHCAGLI